MDTTYILFLLTFLLFPIIAIITYQFIQFDKINNFIKSFITIFIIYDILFFFGVSFKGDYADYIMFSIQYLVVCFGLCLKPKNSLNKFLLIAGRTSIILGFVIGLLGIFFFIVVSQDYEVDKVFYFKSDNKNFETRRYSFGFATFESTKYTFETYREFKFLPFEKRIDKTIFFDTKSKVAIYEDELQIALRIIDNKESLIFKDKQGNVFSKLIE